VMLLLPNRDEVFSILFIKCEWNSFEISGWMSRVQSVDDLGSLPLSLPVVERKDEDEESLSLDDDFGMATSDTR